MLRVLIRVPASLAARKICFLAHPSDMTVQDLNSEVSHVQDRLGWGLLFCWPW